MIQYLKKRYALSQEGARDLVIATIACVFEELSLMSPVGLLYLLVSDYLDGTTHSILFYILAIIVIVGAIYGLEFWKYNATYFSTYLESGKARVRLAEKLRTLPLSYFGQKDASDLTNTLLGDVEKTEKI